MLPSRCWSPPVVGRRPGACGDVRVGWQPWAPHSGLCRASEREEPRLSMPKDDDPDRGRVLLCLGPDSSRWDGWPAPVSLIGPTGPAHRIFNSEKGIVDANSGNNQLPRAWIFLSITEFFPLVHFPSLGWKGGEGIPNLCCSMIFVSFQRSASPTDSLQYIEFISFFTISFPRVISMNRFE